VEAIFEAWPWLSVALASGTVLIAAPVVRSAVQWTKTRIRRRKPDMSHAVVHLLNAVFSLAVGFAFAQQGRVAEDPVFGTLDWPWSWLLFSAAVFWRAGGKHDEEAELARAHQ